MQKKIKVIKVKKQDDGEFVSELKIASQIAKEAIKSLEVLESRLVSAREEAIEENNKSYAKVAEDKRARVRKAMAELAKV